MPYYFNSSTTQYNSIYLAKIIKTDFSGKVIMVVINIKRGVFMDHVMSIYDSLEYINQNLNGDVSLEILAEKACLSKFHYHRLFHQAVGEAVSKYVSKLRMESAAKELTETDHPIIDIALKYQYGSQEAFSRAFKRFYHIAPGNYRKIYSRSTNNNIICLSSITNNDTCPWRSSYVNQITSKAA